MSQAFECPHCRTKVVVQLEHFGRVLSCPACKRHFQVPAAAPMNVRVTTPPSFSTQVEKKRGSLLDWVRDGISNLVFSEANERRARQTDALHNEIVRLRNGFRLEQAIATIGISNEDLSAVREEVYLRFLKQSWQDSVVTDAEGKMLAWLAQALAIPQDRLRRLNWDVGHHVFNQVLSAALSDRYVDENEKAELDRIASSLGTTLPSLMQGYFRSTGEGLLRNAFVFITENGGISPTGWNRLLQTTERLGFQKQELLNCVQEQVRQLAEQTIANAKEDWFLSENEERAINWLMAEFVVPGQFRNYLELQIRELREFTDMTKGRLPSIPHPPHVALRAGEIVHFHGHCRYELVKHLKSGPKQEVHIGTVTVTDNRIIFSSPTRALILLLRNILECNWWDEGIELRTTGKGAGVFNFGDKTRFAYSLLKTAVGRVNQTVVEQIEGKPSGHIPRDVRQRIWQKYGGRCADCGSDQYLEFDHIVPRSRGGSDSDANVQLLCRGCNGKKSDHI